MSTGFMGSAARASANRFPSYGSPKLLGVCLTQSDPNGISLRAVVCACCSNGIARLRYVSTLHMPVVLPSFQLKKSLHISACPQNCSADKIDGVSGRFRVRRYRPWYNVLSRCEFSSESVGLCLESNETWRRRRQYACTIGDCGSAHSTTELMRRNELQMRIVTPKPKPKLVYWELLWRSNTKQLAPPRSLLCTATESCPRV